MKILHPDCYACTVPGESGSNGLKIANALEQQGAHVIGWDLEWNMNFNVNRCKVSVQRIDMHVLHKITIIFHPDFDMADTRCS